jgi:hypothetical protein
VPRSHRGLGSHGEPWEPENKTTAEVFTDGFGFLRPETLSIAEFHPSLNDDNILIPPGLRPGDIGGLVPTEDCGNQKTKT